MPNNIFSQDELDWLFNHKEIAACIDAVTEDCKNVNPLDDGTPNMAPYLLAVKAGQIVIGAAQQNIILGPYDQLHYEMILKHIECNELYNKGKADKFWNIFSFHCACSFEEDEDKQPVQIYMEALMEILGDFEGLDELPDPQNETYDISNGLQKIAGKGINARFLSINTADL